jgi:hypothetical protein
MYVVRSKEFAMSDERHVFRGMWIRKFHDLDPGDKFAAEAVAKFSLRTLAVKYGKLWGRKFRTQVDGNHVVVTRVA